MVSNIEIYEITQDCSSLVLFAVTDRLVVVSTVGDHMKEWSMGPAQARAVARNRPREWSRKVSASKSHRGTCS